jgi:hypothetical protein
MSQVSAISIKTLDRVFVLFRDWATWSRRNLGDLSEDETIILKYIFGKYRMFILKGNPSS